MADNEIVEEQLKYWKSYISGAGFEAHNAWLAIRDVLAIPRRDETPVYDHEAHAAFAHNELLDEIKQIITNRLGGME